MVIFFPRKPDWPEQYPSIVIRVRNIKETMNLINESGEKY